MFHFLETETSAPACGATEQGKPTDRICPACDKVVKERIAAQQQTL